MSPRRRWSSRVGVRPHLTIAPGYIYFLSHGAAPGGLDMRGAGAGRSPGRMGWAAAAGRAGSAECRGPHEGVGWAEGIGSRREAYGGGGFRVECGAVGADGGPGQTSLI